MPTRTQTDRQKIRDEHRDSWIAVNPGDSIMGPIVDVTDAWSDQRRDPVTNRQGSSYPLLTIEAEEAEGYEDLPKELKVHCFGAVLFNEIMRKRPGIGERIRITYRGTGEAKAGQNPPELYTVRAPRNSDAAARAYGAIDGSGATGRAQGQPTQPPLPTPDDDDIPF